MTPVWLAFYRDGGYDHCVGGLRPNSPLPIGRSANDRDEKERGRGSQWGAWRGGNKPGVAGRGQGSGEARGRRRSSGESKRRDRHRSARNRQRRRARDQDRESDYGAGDSGTGVRHSYRAIPEFPEAALSRGWGFGPGGIAAESAATRDHLAHQNFGRPEHR